MQTRFTETQLKDPVYREADAILRSCVHCGFCLSTCPTYVLTGDELDSPRGRIYLIKDMLERDVAPEDATVTHIDRCLSCLSCMTTCPSSVDYMHLADIARARIAARYKRPPVDRLFRGVLARVLPSPRLFALAIGLGRPLAGGLARLPGRIGTLGRLIPKKRAPAQAARARVFAPAEGPPRLRVALLEGCVQTTLAPDINGATIRLLTRLGAEVHIVPRIGCCGALAHHLADHKRARRQARRNVRHWSRALDRPGLDAVVANAAGCGTLIKDYGHLLAGDRRYADSAARVAACTLDVSEVVERLMNEVPSPTLSRGPRPRIAYHGACSLRNGQKIEALPKALLRRMGFEVVDIPEGHLCCGSAGTYNLLEPGFADMLGRRKAERIARTGAEMVASGNIGCQMQISAYSGLPVVHTVALLDWATGGPDPRAGV
ncbi:MAG: glycolate oxidase subunit GlcF [Alphaproteobacteria bacterium]